MKSILSLLIAIGISFSSHAQSKTAVGFNGGFHFGSVYVDHTIYNFPAKFGNYLSYRAGITIKHQITGTSSEVRYGINWIKKGWKQIFQETNEQLVSALEFVEIPFDGIIYLNKKRSLHFMLGVHFIALVDIKTSGSVPTDTNQKILNVTHSNTNQLLFGGHLGFGVTKKYSFGTLQLEPFLSFDLSNITITELTNSDLPDLTKIWHTGLTLSYYFISP